MIGDWLGGLAQWLLGGPLLVGIAVLVLAVLGAAVVGVCRRVRFRLAQRRVHAEYARAIRERVVVPGQRTGGR